MKKWYLIIFLILGLVSACGTRKVEMQLQKAETKQLREIVLSIQNHIQTNVRLTKIGQVKIVEPIVTEQPSNYNGETFQNAKITIAHTHSDSTAFSTDTSQKEVTDTFEKKTVTKEKTKDTKSKKPNPWLWLGFVIVICFFGWLVWRKIKN